MNCGELVSARLPEERLLNIIHLDGGSAAQLDDSQASRAWMIIGFRMKHGDVLTNHVKVYNLDLITYLPPGAGDVSIKLYDLIIA